MVAGVSMVSRSDLFAVWVLLYFCGWLAASGLFSFCVCLLHLWTFVCFACLCAASSKFFCGYQLDRCGPSTRFDGFSSRVAWGVAWPRWLRLFVFAALLRVGEAQHPGPSDSDVWTCEIFNPSGLSTKVDYVCSLPGDILLGSETHLTRSGVARLRQGLRLQGSRFKSVVAGAPCPQRVHADAGTYAGVVALSAYPARPLPHTIDPELFDTARLLVCGVAVRQTWVQIGVAYGFPKSTQHKHRTYRTECLLDELITRVAVQSRGPRIVGGDFNHSTGELQQLDRLRDLGFREVQDLACQMWGYDQQPTSSGPHNIDQLWISPELQSLLVDVSVDWDTWSSHATVRAHFKHGGPELDRPLWFMPSPFPWPPSFDLDCTVDWSQPTLGFASWWFQLEHAAAAVCSSQPPSASFGRGQTMEVTPSRLRIAPCKLGRPGDLQPTYFGGTLKHTRWFKQLRRIHALSRMMHSSSSKPGHVVKQLELWKAIRCAVGFSQGFCAYWISTFDRPFVHSVPLCLPSVHDVDVMLALFKVVVGKLETQLGASRAHHARARRLSDAHLVFKDCMRDAPNPVDSLVLSQQVGIDELCPDDVSVVLDSPVLLNPELPLVAHGKAYPIIYACHDQVWLSKLDGLQVGDTMRQEKVVSTDVAIISEFTSAWQSRWVKFSQLEPGQWDQISAFCARRLPSLPPAEWIFPDWNLDLVRGAVRGKKSKAAVGPDGISRLDLLSLPDGALFPLVDLYRSLESSGLWPQQLLQGFVSCLDKGKGDGGIDTYRPIVIYPLITRLWSTVRARQALLCLSAWLPGGLHGGVPKKQAKSIWFKLAQMLETSHFLNTSLLGIAVDIQRAFNNLPREPLFQAVLCLGLPECILRPWASFVFGQSRRFRIRGAVGGAVGSTVGFPEGCAWSVFAMAIADWMLTLWLDDLVVSPHEALTFVDDWHIVFVDPGIFDVIWRSLTSFSAAMQLPIDVRKSFCWASLSSDRHSLLQSPVSSVLAARDLGAHQNFSLRSGNRTVLDRLHKLRDLWHKLRKSVAPYSSKLFVLTQMAYPRAMHGISVVHLGANRFTDLRAGAMLGLRTNRVGSNPYLRFMQHGILCDPEGWAIVQTVREIREVGNLEQMESMLELRAGGFSVPSNGPCNILVTRLQRLGWSLNRDGLFADVLGPFNVLRMSWTAFVMRAQLSWPRVAAAAVSHRKSLAGLQFADIAECRKVLAAMGSADLKFLQCCLDGTLYQDLKKSKDQRGSGSRCTYCGAVDSPYHRVWICPHFSSCRTRCRFLPLIPHLDPCLTCHGWPIVPAAWYDLARLFVAVPDVEVSVKWPVLPPDHVFHLFVDGACHFPAEPKLRYASWGVTLASTGYSSLDHLILSCGHVKGLEQTAFRGELEAMLWALRAIAAGGVRAVIWSDCDSVVNKVRKLLRGHVFSRNRPHADIWEKIAALVADGSLAGVEVQKVVSHCDVATADSDIELWAFWHNALVDSAASSYNNRRSDEFWKHWDTVRQALGFHRAVHKDVVDVLLQVGRMAKQGDAQQLPQEVVPPAVPIQQPGQWATTPKLSKLYRAENVAKLHEWWCEHGVPALSSRGPLRWVSGVQLWADFVLTTGWQGPVSPRAGRWFLGNGDQPPTLVCHLDLRAKNFLRLWRAYLKANKVVVQSKVQRPHSFALAYWSLCFHLAWPDSRLTRIDTALFSLDGRQICKPAVLAAHLELPHQTGDS